MINSDLPNDVILANLIALSKNNYDLIYFEDAKLENEIYRAIAIKRDTVLGRGSFGNVYLGYPIDITTGNIIPDKKLAVKKFKDTRSINTNEAKFFKAYHGACEIIQKDNDIYMVMNYIPGADILVHKKDSTVLNQEISQFNFVQRVDLVYNIMLAINIIHHHTPKTGQALIHGDINGNNIKVNYDPETKKIDVYIIDFGLSVATIDDPDRLQPASMEGTPLYMSKEIVADEAHGIKSDIYALTPIFMTIFGASNVFNLKKALHFYNPDYYKTPYDFSGIFDGIDVPNYPGDVKLYIKKFLTRMQNEDFARRPDSDETLRFFTSLQILTKIYEADPLQPEVITTMAKLAVMADGIWKESEFYSSIDERVTNLPPAPEYFDFNEEDKLAVSNAIIAIAKQKNLNSPLLQRIMTGKRGILTKTKACIFPRVQLHKDKEQENDTIRNISSGSGLANDQLAIRELSNKDEQDNCSSNNKVNS